MRVKVDYGDGTEPEEIDVTDGSRHFHPYADNEKHKVTVEVLESDDEDEDDDEYDPNAPEHDYAIEVGYDPAAHTVTEVIGYVEDNPDQLDAIYATEEVGKGRRTLLSHLEGLRPS